MEIQKDVDLKRAAREFLGKSIEDDIDTITDFTQLIVWIQRPNIKTSISKKLEEKMLGLIGVCTNYQDLADWYIRTIPVAVKYQIREKMFELNSLQLPIDNFDELLKRLKYWFDDSSKVQKQLDQLVERFVNTCVDYDKLITLLSKSKPGSGVEYQIQEKMFELNELQLSIDTDNYDELLKRYRVMRCGHKIKRQLEEEIVEYVKVCISYHGLRKLFLESNLGFETQKQIIDRTIELDKVCNNLDELMRRWYESENCYSADVRHNLETRIIEKVVESRNVVINLFKKSKCPYFLEKYLKSLAEQILQC